MALPEPKDHSTQGYGNGERIMQAREAKQPENAPVMQLGDLAKNTLKLPSQVCHAPWVVNAQRGAEEVGLIQAASPPSLRAQRNRAKFNV